MLQRMGMTRSLWWTLALGLAATASGCQKPPAFSEEQRACVERKEREAIAQGRMQREDPGSINAWALKQCGVDPDAVLTPFVPAADNLRTVESTRAIPPGAR